MGCCHNSRPQPRAKKEPYWSVDVHEWDIEHVFSWISSIDAGNLGTTAMIFKQNKINGTILLDLTDDKMKEFNIPIGDRILILSEHKLLTCRPEISYSDVPTAHTQHNKRMSKNESELAQSIILHNKLNHSNSQRSIHSHNRSSIISNSKPEKFEIILTDELQDRHEVSTQNTQRVERSKTENMETIEIICNDSNRSLTIPGLPSLNDSIKHLKENIRNILTPSKMDHDKNDFVILDSPESSTNSHRRLPMIPSANDTEWTVKSKETEFMNEHNRIPIGLPMLNNKYVSYDASQKCHEANGSLQICGGCGSDEFMELPTLDYEDSAIRYLTTKHTKTLFMLTTTKMRLIGGFLREDGVYKLNVHVPNGILRTVLDYYDDSAMYFNISITNLMELSRENKESLHQLQASKFYEFDFNMDHEIQLRPVLTHQMRENDFESVNDIELTLECEALPIKIDKCKILVKILCIVHEVKYQKMDIYYFGTDLKSDNAGYNVLNKCGLKMIIPQSDIRTLTDLKFKINATVLEIEYDPFYENYGICPMYNANLTMDDECRYLWKISERILKTMKNDIFKQQFFSNHFANEYWCLSAYKSDDVLIINLNLLRLAVTIESIGVLSMICVRTKEEILWQCKAEHIMDTEYKNTFAYTVSAQCTQRIFADDVHQSIYVDVGVAVKQYYNQKGSAICSSLDE